MSCLQEGRWKETQGNHQLSTMARLAKRQVAGKQIANVQNEIGEQVAAATQTLSSVRLFEGLAQRETEIHVRVHPKVDT